MLRPRRARSLFACWALAFALAGAAGCMFLVEDELGSIRCLDEGAYGPPACPDRHGCIEGLCAPRDVPSPGIGTPCGSDADCNAGDFCLDPRRFGDDASKVCSRNCCSSSDCDQGPPDAGVADQTAVCWVPKPGGGSFCRLAGTLDRGVVGAGKGGAECKENGECRSGLCEEDRCTDACCSDTNCDLTAARCQVSDDLASDGATWACAPNTPAVKAFLEPCATDEECVSGLCVKMADFLLCSRPCCDSESCGPFNVGGVEGQLACVHLPRHGSLVSACAQVLPVEADQLVGAPCTEDAQCRSGDCVQKEGAGAGLCSDLCCVDADCGDPAAFACRPHELGEAWALRCELLPPPA